MFSLYHIDNYLNVDAELQWKGKTGMFYSVVQHCVAQSLERKNKKAEQLIWKNVAMCFIVQNPLSNDIVCFLWCNW